MGRSMKGRLAEWISCDVRSIYIIWYEWFGDVMLVVDRCAEAACPH